MRRAAAAVALAVLAGCTNGGGGPRPEPSGSPTPSAAPARRQLVYATEAGVHAVAAGEAPRLVTPVKGEIGDLAVSADGRYAAVLASEGATRWLEVVELATGRTASWGDARAPLYAGEVGSTPDGFVVVTEDERNVLLTFEPAATLAGAPPRETKLLGVTSARLVATGTGRVLVATAERAGEQGGPETVYDVESDGSTKLYFTDGERPRAARPRNLPIGAAGVSKDGAILVYGTAYRGREECELDFYTAVVDLPNRREYPTTMPSLGEDVFTVVHSVTTGPDGRTVVGLSTELGGCGSEPRGDAYTVVGGRWALVARGAIWAAASLDRRLATLDADRTLRLEGAVVARDVALAAWTPV